MFSLSGAGGFRQHLGVDLQIAASIHQCALDGCKQPRGCESDQRQPGVSDLRNVLWRVGSRQGNVFDLGPQFGHLTLHVLNIEGGLSVGSGSTMTSSGAWGTMAAIIASGASTTVRLRLMGRVRDNRRNVGYRSSRNGCYFLGLCGFSAPLTNGRLILNAFPRPTT